MKECGSQSNTFVASVEYSVESLEESHADDKVESFSTGGAEITSNQVNSARNTANDVSRPYLGIGSQSKCSLDKNGLILH